MLQIVDHNLFQSTRPVRGATYAWSAWYDVPEFQSTRPVRGATRNGRSASPADGEFQSTRPVRGATQDRPPHRI
ncbi:hypothetical protein HMPREF9081_1903 [Centipeda periodontii DSM 2778]|uniref:Uncharacterized protein n=1 Tax=Centipeda periodontii DSM 2778 TaxID=888060 RepID=F5RNT2_9FIRM|nr:hypothetical protein HMPREF9081_1903 [Centipeda periodontii DSM 2778]